jgi:hypothetical protein
VTDSGGRVEGIGSRFFHVFNGVGGGPVGDVAVARITESPVRSPGPSGPGDGDLRARVGFDVDAPFEVVPADADGVHQIRLKELGRLELQVGEANAGYLMANGTPRDLPDGSHLDTAAGVFTWAPGAGFFGTYRLAFEGGRVRSPGSSDPGNVWSPAGAQVLVDVTVGPAAKAASGEGEIRMHVDMPATGETVSGEFRVAGWALDPWAAFGSGIGAVHVWAEDVFLGVAELGGARPDVAAAFGSQFGQAGFGLTTRGLAPGTHDVTVYAWNRRTGRWEDARTVRVTVR